jgi:hypothetical protein
MPEDAVLAVCGRGDRHVNSVHRGDTRTLLVFLCFYYKLHQKTSQELAAQILLSPSSACEFVWFSFLTLGIRAKFDKSCRLQREIVP